MTLRRSLAGILAVAAGAFVLTWRGGALAAAEARADQEAAALSAVDGDLARVAALATRPERVAAGRRPEQDVIAQVNAVLRSAGLRADRFRHLEPEADQWLADHYRRQTLRLSLEKVTPVELGRFLAEWRAATAVWTPAGIELTHAAAEAGREDLYDVRLVLAATYLGDGGPETQR